MGLNFRVAPRRAPASERRLSERCAGPSIRLGGSTPFSASTGPTSTERCSSAHYSRRAHGRERASQRDAIVLSRDRAPEAIRDRSSWESAAARQRCAVRAPMASAAGLTMRRPAPRRAAACKTLANECNSTLCNPGRPVTYRSPSHEAARALARDLTMPNNFIPK